MKLRRKTVITLVIVALVLLAIIDFFHVSGSELSLAELASDEAIITVEKDYKASGKIITVEDHNIINGLGGAVCEVAAETGKAIVKRIGIQDQFAPIGLHEDIMSTLGIDSNGIIAAVREAMNADFELDDDWDDEV